MSAVALEADERATLVAALALVDDCDPSVWRPLAATTIDREMRPLAGTGQHEPAQSAQSLPSAQAKRCDHRKRHRVEIARLRDQVVDLEAHLTQLQRYCGHDAPVAASPPAVKRARVQASPNTREPDIPRLLSQLWFKKAVVEFKMLQRAKQRNLDLKDAFQEQRNVSATLEQLFQLKLSKQDLDFLSEVAKQNAENSVGDPKNDPRPSPFADMLVHLEKLYASTPEIISQISIRRDMSRIFHSSHSERDPSLGSSHEFTTNTPLTCSLRELEQFLWQQVQVSARIECRKPCHRFHQAPQVKPVRNGCETHVSVEFSEAVGGRCMDGMFVIRKFVEPNRVVLTLTARITFSGSALVIREDGWVVMNDQSASSLADCETLLQTHYRIHVEKQDPEMTQEIEHLREFVVNFLSEKMKSSKLQMRDLMLQIQDAVGLDKIQRELSFECIACGFNAAMSS